MQCRRLLNLLTSVLGLLSGLLGPVLDALGEVTGLCGLVTREHEPVPRALGSRPGPIGPVASVLGLVTCPLGPLPRAMGELTRWLGAVTGGAMFPVRFGEAGAGSSAVDTPLFSSPKRSPLGPKPTGGADDRLSHRMDAGDADLVRQACAGDHGAFRQLVDRHSRRLYQMAYRMTGNQADAEDVVQDTFIRAFRQLHRFESRASFATWLYRIGMNCALDATGRSTRREVPEEPATLDARPHHARADAHTLLYAGEISTQVNAAMSDLTTQERAAFIMRHCDDCSIEEIGLALGLNTSATKHSVFRAVRKLRMALRPFAEAQWGTKA